MNRLADTRTAYKTPPIKLGPMPLAPGFGQITLWPSPQMTTAINQINLDDAPQLRELLEKSHSWFSHTNFAQAQEAIAAACMASEKGLSHQFDLQLAQLVELYTKDMADRTVHFACIHLGYHEFRYYASTQEHRYERSFQVPIGRRWGYDHVWLYRRLHEFGGTIPLHALQALAALEITGIQPDEFWVADKVAVAVQIGNSFSLDPVLCCAFGNHFVGIAEWI